MMKDVLGENFSRDLVFELKKIPPSLFKHLLFNLIWMIRIFVVLGNFSCWVCHHLIQQDFLLPVIILLKDLLMPQSLIFRLLLSLYRVQWRLKWQSGLCRKIDFAEIFYAGVFCDIAIRSRGGVLGTDERDIFVGSFQKLWSRDPFVVARLSIIVTVRLNFLYLSFSWLMLPLYFKL